MANILGISAYYHDSAAALLLDGRIVAAAQEERFTRRKHDASFPIQAIDYCLQEARINADELDHVVFYEKPLLRLDRFLETCLAYAPRGYCAFRRAMRSGFLGKLDVRRDIRRTLVRTRATISYTEHHEAHAASAFFPSPFEESAVLTLDGVGEWSTGTIGHGQGNRLCLLREMSFPHSLGLLYSAFTYYLGFRVNSGEYKVMGLAPYGKPRFKDLILGNIVDVRPDGSLRLDMSYFRFGYGLRMTGPKFHQLLGGPPREPESSITERDMDIAASIQAVTEEAVLRCAITARELTKSARLVMAGGVALNCAAAAKVLEYGPFKEMWIQPAAGDAGGSLGAALFVHHQLLGARRDVNEKESIQPAALGPSFSDSEIRSALQSAGAVFHSYSEESRDDLLLETVNALSRGEVIGWFQGRIEFGPRALGHRSILADPRNENMRERINAKIKLRESFRPFAPAVLAEEAHHWFQIPPDKSLPFMTFTVKSRADQIGHAALRQVVPAVTHVDGTSRLQTVNQHDNQLFHGLLKRFFELTGCPMLVNTSFNVRGEPIVCTPTEAWRCFMLTDLDGLVIGNNILWKHQQNADLTTDQLIRSSRIGTD